MEKAKQSIRYIRKSKYIRSILISVIPIFIVVTIVFIATVLLLFTNEVRESAIQERKQSLEQIETKISQRLLEINSISFNIESNFYLDSKIDKSESKEEMSESLEKYLVGNDFIEHLAFYRLSEPDVIYVSKGVMNFSEFWKAYLHVDDETMNMYINSIISLRGSKFHYIDLGTDESSYFSYVCPLPMLSDSPKAFVLMLIPYNNVKELLLEQIQKSTGVVALYDNDGEEIIKLNNAEGTSFEKLNSINLIKTQDLEKIRIEGTNYLVQKCESNSNSWTIASSLSLDNVISNLADKMLWSIFLLVLFLFFAVSGIIFIIIKKYKPIFQLALDMYEKTGNDKQNVINEGNIISNTFSSLKEDKHNFENAYYEAEAINKAKSAFFSNMSHDIRTPMNAIIGMTEIAKKHYNNPDKVLECLNNVTISSQYLLEIINNVLDMSRIESGRLVLNNEKVFLPSIIYEIEMMMNNLLTEKKIDLLFKTDTIVHETIYTDKLRLKQVFINIISNAIKFTNNNGKITVLLEEKPLDKDNISNYRFTFIDTGIGMSKEFQKKLFIAFERDENSIISQIEGTGLGLAIAKSFVGLMGGDIKCISELGKGSTFIIDVPLKTDNTTYNYIPKNKKILLICESSSIYENVYCVLTKYEAVVDYSLSIDEATTLINHKKYDFVIFISQSYSNINMRDVFMLNQNNNMRETELVLAIRDPASVEQSVIYDAGIRKTIQIPFFNSTVYNLLNSIQTIPEKYLIDSNITNLQGMRIILVDDNYTNRLIAKGLIDETGATVYEATNGKEAVDKYLSQEAGFYDIILMDIQMPIMNGYDATTTIRSSKRNDSLTLPIYAMTANTFEDEVNKALSIGMNGHIAKPYSVSELYNVLTKVWNEKKRR